MKFVEFNRIFVYLLFTCIHVTLLIICQVRVCANSEVFEKYNVVLSIWCHIKQGYAHLIM